MTLPLGVAAFKYSSSYRFDGAECGDDIEIDQFCRED